MTAKGEQGELPLGPRPLPAAKRPRQRDLLFDAVVAACGIDATVLTAPARGAVNRALRELREVGAEPEDVAPRAEVFHVLWPSIPLTPRALSKHWPVLGHPSTQRVSERQRTINEVIERAVSGTFKPYRDVVNLHVRDDLL